MKQEAPTSISRSSSLDQPAIIIDMLIKSSVPHEFHFYGDKDTELGHVFMLRIREDAAKICNDEECAFFRKNMD